MWGRRQASGDRAGPGIEYGAAVAYSFRPVLELCRRWRWGGHNGNHRLSLGGLITLTMVACFSVCLYLEGGFRVLIQIAEGLRCTSGTFEL